MRGHWRQGAVSADAEPRNVGWLGRRQRHAGCNIKVPLGGLCGPEGCQVILQLTQQRVQGGALCRRRGWRRRWRRQRLVRAPRRRRSLCAQACDALADSPRSAPWRHWHWRHRLGQRGAVLARWRRHGRQNRAPGRTEELKDRVVRTGRVARWPSGLERRSVCGRVGVGTCKGKGRRKKGRRLTA